MPERDSTPTDTSVVVTVVRDLRDPSSWLESSSVVRLYRRTCAETATAATNSALAHLLGLLAAWTCESFLYRWLTTEPDPESVVIDLRETLSVGPIIALLDRVLRWIVPYWAQSVPGRILGVLVDWGERVADTRVGRLMVAVLEPPEPPERVERHPDSSGRIEGSSESELDGRGRREDGDE